MEQFNLKTSAYLALLVALGNARHWEVTLKVKFTGWPTTSKQRYQWNSQIFQTYRSGLDGV
eukprot:9014101-Pyramimonas_sp.AAC.1